MNRSIKFGAGFALMLTTAFSLGQQVAKVVVNGTPVRPKFHRAIVKDDRVLVPVRGVLEQIGAKVTWDPALRTVTAESESTKIQLRIGVHAASVNGKPVLLDVPAQIIDGSTMVPLRFVAQALGDQVEWYALAHTVTIITIGGSDVVSVEPNQDKGRAQQLRRTPTREPVATVGPLMLRSGTVVPARLDTTLSSVANSQGDRFVAVVTSSTAGIPMGTPIEGFVAGIRPATGGDPGIIELRFDQIDLPGARHYRIDGALIGLGPSQVSDNNGVLTALDRDVRRGAIAGIGTGPGTFIQIMGGQPIDQSSIRALLGYSVDVDSGHVRDVTINNTTRFGIKLNSDIDIP